MKRFLLCLLTIGAAFSLQAADINGVVLDDKGEPLPGANVYWRGTAIGVVTDPDGTFVIQEVHSTDYLVSSFMGFTPDTTRVKGQTDLVIVLVSDLILDEVTITERKAGIIKSRIAAFDTQTIGADELCKAACCNLSEAFETNASVDVAYSDAATGAKQIKLLGLSGTYVQLLQENTPGVRGLAQSYGMEYIPGPWMQSIQVSKGTSSVINGYEATTGQINVEFQKPQTTSPVAINLMLNSELHAEANLTGGWKIPLKHSEEEHAHSEEEHAHDSEGEHHHDEHCHHESLYTGILAHYQQGFMAMDENKDGFADMPKSQNANLVNRWFYRHGDYTMQVFLRGLYDRRRGGQMADSLQNPYRIDLNTWRVEGFLKNGYVYDDESGSSVAVIAAASYHNQLNRYGLREWRASQANAYLNALWQGNFEGRGKADNDHRVSAGLSLNFDKYDETLNSLSLDRWEVTPGVFAEYSLKYEDILSLVAGVRADYSTRYGFFCTPRVNVRYSPWKWWTLRASAGLGYRSPNVIADNASFLPSSRTIVWNGDAAQERAVNTGISTTFYIPLGRRELQLSAEYYYTQFLNSVIVDMDQATDKVYIYNQRDLPGAQSRAHNAQIEASIEVLRGWTWTAAFRWTDVRQTTIGSDGVARLRLKPLSNQFKGVITTSYQTPLKKWQFDVTAQFNGGGRMPDGFNTYFLQTLGSRQYYEQNGTLYYKWYPQLMAQITKYWRTCSLYMGAENMTNFRQEHPVIGADQPFNDGFDASMAWAPTTGWKVYVGFRWALDKD